MDPAACRVIYIDDRFDSERWISREGFSSPTTPQRTTAPPDFTVLPPDLQANINAFLSVFNQVFVCRSGRSFSTKLSEIHERASEDCTPILACFDVGPESRHDHHPRARPRFHPGAESPLPSPGLLRREITFSSESDESYGLQLLSRIASDLQVDEGVHLIIPVAVVKPRRKDSYDQRIELGRPSAGVRAPLGQDIEASKVEDTSDIINPQLMLQCLDAGALDVVRSPLDKAGIMGLTVHAYRIYKSAKAEQSAFMAKARRGRKQSWVGVQEERPYAYLREAMVKKLLKGICDPQDLIEDYQHRDLFIEEHRKKVIAHNVGQWTFSAQDFTEDELVYAGYYILDHVLQVPELSKWKLPQQELLRFMQGCRVAYNSFVLYHNFKHAVDVLQSTFYFLLRIGTVPPYPGGAGSSHVDAKSPVAALLGPFEALTLLISAIGHDVGHPGVNNMFLVKLNAPLAQLYNDTSVLEAFHCAAYSQILRRHWPSAFHDKAVRKLMISSILATDMGCHSDYMQQLGNLQEKIHESKVTDGWTPKDMDTFRVLTCGLIIKCADISNVSRPWAVAEKWTHKLQEEFAHQGEMEKTVGMETTLFGGPPELGNLLKLANGQIGFITIFAHPLFANVADVIPAMKFAADEILTNKGVWLTRAEQEKRVQTLSRLHMPRDGGVSPRTQSPVGHGRKPHGADRNHFAGSPLQAKLDASAIERDRTANHVASGPGSTRSSLAEAAALVTPPQPGSERSSQDQVTRNRSTLGLPGVEDGRAADHLEAPWTGRPADARSVDDAHRSGAAPQSSHVDSSDHGGAPSDDAIDTRRDNAVSMRAGSATLPILNQERGEPENARGHPSETSQLDKFTFATSDPDDPVRTYDPRRAYHPASSATRASAPTRNWEQSRGVQEMSEPDGRTATAHSDPNTMVTSLRGGNVEDPLTPSHSPEATSYMTERSEGSSPTPHPAAPPHPRDRAISAPSHGHGMGVLHPTFSLDSDKADSRGSSKHDIRTTVLSNGEHANDERPAGNDQHVRRTNDGGGAMGRRRSRLKFNLAFWKKRSGDREPTTADGDRPDTRSTTQS